MSTVFRSTITSTTPAGTEHWAPIFLAKVNQSYEKQIMGHCARLYCRRWLGLTTSRFLLCQGWRSDAISRSIRHSVCRSEQITHDRGNGRRPNMVRGKAWAPSRSNMVMIPDLNPDICRVVPKMYWIHSLRRRESYRQVGPIVKIGL